MATSVDESFLEEFDVNETQIIRLQALFRGGLVRRWIKQIKQDYLDVFREIEQNDRNSVEWPFKSLCYPVIQKTRKHFTSAARSHHNSRRSSTSSPREGYTNMSDKKENQEKWFNVEDFREHRHAGKIISSPRTCSPRLQQSERSGSTAFRDETNVITSKNVQQQEQDRQSQSSRSPRCFNIEKEQDLEIQNFENAVSTEMESPLNKNMETGDRLEILHTEKKFMKKEAVTEQTQIVIYNASQNGFKNDKDFVLCSVETQTSLIENFDSPSKDTKISHLRDLEEINSIKSKEELSSQKSNTGDSGKDLTIFDKKNTEIHQESFTDDDTIHRKANVFQKDYISELDHEKPLMESENVLKKRHLHDRQEDGRSPEYIMQTPKKPELSTFTNVTSVWDSVSSYQDITSETSEQIYPSDRASLQEMRKNIAMELLWVQQAINSRKNYLRLKKDMDLQTKAATRS